MDQDNKPKLSLKQRIVAYSLIVIGVFALVTPFTPGSWLALIGLGILLEKTPRETYEHLKARWSKFWKGRKK